MSGRWETIREARPAGRRLLVVQGCASFNANYKANKYADEARRLDREGRTLEAGGYWGRASVKADSLLVHSPNGKYAPGALAITGEAYAVRGPVRSGEPVLPSAIERLKNEDDREQATLALASCRAPAGFTGPGANTVLPCHREPRWYPPAAGAPPARHRRAPGRPRLRRADSPCRVLPGTPALVQRTLAYAGLHDAAAATSAFDSLVALRDSMLPWDSLLTITGRVDPGLASHLTSTLVTSKTLSLERSAALSFADATSPGLGRHRPGSGSATQDIILHGGLG